MLVKFFLYINNFFPKKEHPFNIYKNWILDLNYTDFEYKNTADLLKMYSWLIDLNILKNKKILDIWCWWWGKAMYISNNFNSEVTGIDLNDTFLKEAISKSLDYKANNVNFISMSALDMKFEDEQFDVIIMSDVLEHIPNTEKLLIESFRVLKKWWIILFDFAPYYHYFWHHIWDTIRIPWLHLITTEKFRIKLYKESIKNLNDWKKRVSLRIWKDYLNNERFDYLNKISRKNFEKIINKLEYNNIFKIKTIKYYMIKNMVFLSYIPFFREVFIRHIVWYLKK